MSAYDLTLTLISLGTIYMFGVWCGMKLALRLDRGAPNGD